MTKLAALGLFERVSGQSWSEAMDLAWSHQMTRTHLSDHGRDRPSDLNCSPSEGIPFVIGTGSNPGFMARKRFEAEAIT